MIYNILYKKYCTKYQRTAMSTIHFPVSNEDEKNFLKIEEEFKDNSEECLIHLNKYFYDHNYINILNPKHGDVFKTKICEVYRNDHKYMYYAPLNRKPKLISLDYDYDDYGVVPKVFAIGLKGNDFSATHWKHTIEHNMLIPVLVNNIKQGNTLECNGKKYNIHKKNNIELPTNDIHYFTYKQNAYDLYYGLEDQDADDSDEDDPNTDKSDDSDSGAEELSPLSKDHEDQFIKIENDEDDEIKSLKRLNDLFNKLNYGVLLKPKHGDVFKTIIGDGYRNMNKYMYYAPLNKKPRLIHLDYNYDEYGAVPKEFAIGLRENKFAANHWEYVIEHNELVPVKVDKIKNSSLKCNGIRYSIYNSKNIPKSGIHYFLFKGSHGLRYVS